jgi:hypothetical protein
LILFEIGVAIVALGAGGIASIAGFGIGSILTPLIASQYAMKTAVGAVTIPHVTATLLRFWRLRACRSSPGFGFRPDERGWRSCRALIHVS